MGGPAVPNCLPSDLGCGLLEIPGAQAVTGFPVPGSISLATWRMLLYSLYSKCTVNSCHLLPTDSTTVFHKEFCRCIFPTNDNPQLSFPNVKQSEWPCPRRNRGQREERKGRKRRSDFEITKTYRWCQSQVVPRPIIKQNAARMDRLNIIKHTHFQRNAIIIKGFIQAYQLLCCLCCLCWGLFTAIAMSWRTPWSVPQASKSAASRPMLCDQRWNGRSSICTEIHLWNLALASGVFDGVHLDVQTTTWTFQIFQMFREAALTAGHLKSKLRRIAPRKICLCSSTGSSPVPWTWNLINLINLKPGSLTNVDHICEELEAWLNFPSAVFLWEIEAIQNWSLDLLELQRRHMAPVLRSTE